MFAIQGKIQIKTFKRRIIKSDTQTLSQELGRATLSKEW